MFSGPMGTSASPFSQWVGGNVFVKLKGLLGEYVGLASGKELLEVVFSLAAQRVKSNPITEDFRMEALGVVGRAFEIPASELVLEEGQCSVWGSSAGV